MINFQILERGDSSFVSPEKEISFDLTFDIGPNEYPGEYPLISTSSRESSLDPVQMLNFQCCLQEYCKKLPLGKISYSYILKYSFNVTVF